MFAKKLFLIASQNSQENNCTGVFLLMQLQARIRHRCSPVNFALFLRRAFLQNTSGHLLLYFIDSARSKKILFSALYKHLYDVTVTLFQWCTKLAATLSCKRPFTDAFMASLIRRLSPEVVMISGLVIRS